MRIRFLARGLATAAVCLGALASTAAAAEPAPFGHPCAVKDGVRFCPAADLSQRVPSFDGVPIDVDVTLPAAGAGPFPAVVLMHGYGGNKGAYEAETADDPAKRFANNLYYAKRGYAVLNISARGFGNSCGTLVSRTAGCAKGWIHLADQRYEARDTQLLLGMLADEGLVDPKRIGVSGASYGGGQSLELGSLRDRVRLPDGRFVRWKSPKGTPMQIAAAAPIIPWADLASALVPNGRWLDTQIPAVNVDISPVGIPISSYINGLYVAGAAAGFVAPLGADPQADLAGWRNVTNAGNLADPRVPRILRQLHDYHSGISLRGKSAPMLISSGWRDDLFPVGQALRVYNRLTRAERRKVPIWLAFSNIGHMPAGNKPATLEANAKLVSRFLDSRLLHKGRMPAPGSVYTSSVSCPDQRPDGRFVLAPSWKKAHRGSLSLSAGRTQRLGWNGGDPLLGRQFDPVGGTSTPCKTLPAETPTATAVAQTRSPGITLTGLTTITARIRTSGRFPYVAARLWEVSGGKQLLVDRGVVRLARGQHRLRFQLHGTAFRFPRGSTIKLELVGWDAPYYQQSTTAFGVTVSGLRATLPTRERGKR